MNTTPTRFAQRPGPSRCFAPLLAPLLLALTMLPMSAHALRQIQSVWAEDFNDVASFAATSVSTNYTSEYWSPAYYSNIDNAHDWQFDNGAYFVDNGQGDGAILLNEGGASGDASQSQPLAYITLTGLVVGYHYSVNFNYWGDNASQPGNGYDVTAYLDGQQMVSLLTPSEAPGTLSAPHFGSFGFQATSDTFQLGFGQIRTGSNSPIIDHIYILLTDWATQDPLHSVPSVPEPGSTALLLVGLLVVGFAQWRSKRPHRQPRAAGRQRTQRELAQNHALLKRLFGDHVQPLPQSPHHDAS